MSLPGRFPWTPSLTPRKDCINHRQGQILHLGTEHRHFALHSSTLLPATHPPSVQSCQHRLLLWRGFGTLLYWASTGLLRFLLLLGSSPFALLVGQQTDFFGTDLGYTEF